MAIIRSIFQGLCCFAFTLNALAQDPQIKSFSLSTQQQAAMGITFAAPTLVETGSLLVSGFVTVPPDKLAVVSAPYPGQITRMLVDIGDTVKSGAALAEFTSPQMGDARRLLLEATSDQRLAKEALARDNLLFKEGIIPQSRLNVTKAKAENAEAMLLARQSELKAASINFEDQKANPSALYATGTIKAPLSGTIVEAYNQIGQRVETGTLLFKIADPSVLVLEIVTSAQKARAIQIGDEITVSNRNAKAKIIAVSQTVNASQSSRIRASVSEKGSLRIGENVTATVLTQKSQNTPNNPILSIPSRAITNWKGQSVIFVYTGTNVSMVPIAIVSSDDDRASVQANIPAQSKIAITGVAALKALAQKAD